MDIQNLKITGAIKLKVYTFGNRPRLLLLSGIHGDEKSGVLILKKMIKLLKKLDHSQTPAVSILPCANPEALSRSTRTNPHDLTDLNRSFPASRVRNHSQKIAKTLQDFAKNFKIIIDLHVFTKQKSLVCGVELRTGNNKTKKQIRKLMGALPLEAICRIDHQHEPAKDGSIAGYLQSLNRLAFGIELPPIEAKQKKQINQFTNNLISFSRNYETVLKKNPYRKLETFTRQQFFSTDAGDFQPFVSPGKKIKKGQIIGQIMLTNFSKINVKSPFNGVLISISYPRHVKKQEKLFVVGKPVP